MSLRIVKQMKLKDAKKLLLCILIYPSSTLFTRQCEQYII